MVVLTDFGGSCGQITRDGVGCDAVVEFEVDVVLRARGSQSFGRPVNYGGCYLAHGCSCSIVQVADSCLGR